MESSVLVISPSALRGAARSLDLWGYLDDYNFSVSNAEADALAFAADSAAVKSDFQVAIDSVLEDIKKAQKEVAMPVE